MKPYFCTAAGLLLWACAIDSSFAADEQPESEPRCLQMLQIDDIEVVNNQTLIFHMHGNRSYINILPNPCYGLKTHSFLHESHLDAYCDQDIITVFDTSIGKRLGSCGLGKFQQYDAVESYHE